MRDLHSKVKSVVSIIPAVYSANATGIGVDTQGFNSVEMLFATGADVGSTHAPEIQHSDSLGSGYVTVPAGDLIGSLPADMAASSAYRQGYKGGKRYVRAFVTTAGISLAYSATCLLSNPDQQPVAEQS